MRERSRVSVATAEVAGRELLVRAIPWDSPTLVSDDGVTSYWEAIARGSCRGPQRDPSRTALTYLHSDDAASLVGHCIALRDEPDGLIARARIHESPGGDQVLAAVREGYLGAVSVRFAARPEDSVRETIDGREVVVRRTIRRLPHIALVPRGAYEDAQVLAVRSAPDMDPRHDWIVRRMRLG